MEVLCSNDGITLRLKLGKLALKITYVLDWYHAFCVSRKL